MDFWIILYIIDWILFGMVALTALYLLIFAITSLFFRTGAIPKTNHQNRFIIIITAYQNKGVIQTVHSVLGQTYQQRLLSFLITMTK